MATIDTGIYGNIKPVQIEDPMNQFARQQEASVNMLKMQEMQQAVQDRNMLRQIDPNDPEYLNKVSRVNPKLGAELGKSRLESDEKRLKLAGDSTKMYMDVLPSVNDPKQMAELTIAQYNDPFLGPVLKRIRPLEQALSTIPTDPQGFATYKQKVGMGMKDFYTHTTLSESQRQNLNVQREGQRLQYDPELQAKIAGAKKRAEGEVAEEIQGKADVKANRKALATAGYDPVTGKDNISKLIQDSTGSFIGAGTDLAGRAVGVSTKGAQSIAQLKAFESKLTQDILGGKLGAGISNTDREFIVQAIGDIANQTLPVETRQAAWDSVKERMRVAGMVEAPQSNINVPGLPQVNVPGGKAAPAARPSLDSIFAPAKK